jgi:hypothetical protein
MYVNRGLSVVVGLLAISAIFAAAAFSAATVTNEGRMALVSTTDAYVALNPGPAAGDNVYEEDNRLYFDFVAGRNSDALNGTGDPNGREHYGLQPGSTYEWFGLFTFVNNDNGDIKTYSIETANVPSGVTVEMRLSRTSGGGPIYTPWQDVTNMRHDYDCYVSGLKFGHPGTTVTVDARMTVDTSASPVNINDMEVTVIAVDEDL